MTQPSFSLEDALARLSRITSTITSLRKEDESGIRLALDLVARNAIDQIPDAVVSICSFDPARGVLDLGGRVEVGQPFWEIGGDPCQANPLVTAAIRS